MGSFTGLSSTSSPRSSSHNKLWDPLESRIFILTILGAEKTPSKVAHTFKIVNKCTRNKLLNVVNSAYQYHIK